MGRGLTYKSALEDQGESGSRLIWSISPVAQEEKQTPAGRAESKGRVIIPSTDSAACSFRPLLLNYSSTLYDFIAFILQFGSQGRLAVDST